MWIFTTKGFFSVVQDKGNSGKVVIRSRLKKDIQNLKEIFHSMRLATTEIVTVPKSDYKYRFFADRQDWITVMNYLMQGVTYTNFKDAVYKNDSKNMRDKRHDAYLDIWSITRSLQNLEK